MRKKKHLVVQPK